MRIDISNDLTISDVPSGLAKTIKESLTLINPEYVKALKYRGRSGRIAKYIKMFSGDKKGRLHCPRGFGLELHQIVKAAGEDIEYEDCRRELDPVDFVFCGELRAYQKKR